MAKQKIPTEDTAQGVGAETFQEQPTEGATTQENTTVETTTTDKPVDAPEPKQQIASADEKREKKQDRQEPDGHILGILKSYPQYQNLYIDRLGGVYTPNTAERIRGNATLYNNPYYKQK